MHSFYTVHLGSGTMIHQSSEEEKKQIKQTKKLFFWGGGANRVKGYNQNRVSGHQIAAANTPFLYFAAVFPIYFFQKNQKVKHSWWWEGLSPPRPPPQHPHEPSCTHSHYKVGLLHAIQIIRYSAIISHAYFKTHILVAKHLLAYKSWLQIPTKEHHGLLVLFF